MDVMAGETSTFLWDIHIEENYQHKGLGKHLVTLLELITRREKISQICIPVQNEDDVALSWVQNALKGYKPHDGLDELLGFDSEAEVSVVLTLGMFIIICSFCSYYVHIHCILGLQYLSQNFGSSSQESATSSK